jgi:hypothetical protein
LSKALQDQKLSDELIVPNQGKDISFFYDPTKERLKEPFTSYRATLKSYAEIFRMRATPTMRSQIRSERSDNATINLQTSNQSLQPTASHACQMKLTNNNYIISIGTKNFTERYYRDKAGWLKVSARSRTFRMTAEQVLNHVLPAVAGIKPNLTIKVEHHDANLSH